MTTKSQPKATTLRRRRAVARGLVRVEVQTARSDVGLFRALAKTLRGQSDKAKALRSMLEKVLIEPKVKTAFDVFGSDLPDDIFADVFNQPRQQQGRKVNL